MGSSSSGSRWKAGSHSAFLDPPHVNTHFLLPFVLCFLIQALERSGMSYCIVRPGGMERPKDDYKESHNLVIKPRDSLFGGQVCYLKRT